MTSRSRTLLLAGLASLAPALAHASCGAAFCTVNSNWTAESAQAEAVNAYDVRFEYMDQDQPYSGTRRLYVGEIPSHHDEVSTVNRNLVASYSHNFGSGLGVTVSAAVGAREHVHIHNHHGARINETWDFTRLGDVRVVGRYQLLGVADPLQPSSAGVTFGLKLPTGQTDVANAAGSVAERSMQPGSGTTDLLLGAYYHRKLTAQDASWFVQGQYQGALAEHDHYRPGRQCNLDVGLRKGVGANLGLLAQLNFLHKASDRGSEAEPASSGGRFVFLSPGVSYALPHDMQLYAFYQHPLYRKVTGVQLTAPQSFVLGVSGRL